MAKRFGEELTAEEKSFLESQRDEAPAPQEAVYNAEQTIPEQETSGESNGEELDTNEPEQAAETDKPKDDAENKTKKNVRVPIARLDEEVEKRRALEKEVEALKKQTEESNKNLEYLRQLQVQLQQSQQPRQTAPTQPQMPTAEDDPIGTLKAMQERLQAFEAANQQSQYENYISSLVAQRESEIRNDVPDYDDATTFLRESFANELRAVGVPENQIPYVMKARAFEATQSALNRGANPAQVFYELAKARGYRVNSNPVAAPVSDSEKIAKIAAGQKQSASLSQVNGASPRGELTYAMLAAMSEKEFARVQKEFPSKVRELLGG